MTYNQPGGEKEESLFVQLREKSVRRAIEGFKCYHEQPITFWTTALAGELGELCNMIKKLQRVKLGGIDTGSSYTSKDITTEMLSEEIGGIAIYLDLLASLLNISLEGAIIYEFNRVSSKYNLQEFLSSPAKVEGDAVLDVLVWWESKSGYYRDNTLLEDAVKDYTLFKQQSK